MKYIFGLIVCFLLFAQHSDAGPWHFIKTHKEELAQDFIVTLDTGGDAWSSINSQRTGGVIEENPLLGHHPSEAKTIGFAIGGTALFDLFNRTISKREPHLGWFAVGPFTVSEAFTIKNNMQQ